MLKRYSFTINNILFMKHKISRIRAFFLSFMFESIHFTVWIEHLGMLIGAKYISIGAYSDIQKQTYLTAWDFNGHSPSIVIGRDCHIGAYNHITCVNRIVMGDGFVSGKYVTITDNDGGVISWASSGTVGFKSSKKKTPFAAGMSAEAAGKAAFDAGIRKVEVFVKGIGGGRETAVRSLQTAGLEITAINDVTPVPHNGCRPPKRRRI